MELGNLTESNCEDIFERREGRNRSCNGGTLTDRSVGVVTNLFDDGGLCQLCGVGFGLPIE